MEKYYCYPGHVLAYYPEKQTADIKISAEVIGSTIDSYNNLTPGAIALGLPVHTTSGGGWSVTVPIAPGDPCLVVFTQVGYSHWFVDNLDAAGTILGEPHPNLSAGNDVSEGLVFVGFNTLHTLIPDYTMDGSQWRNQDATQSIHLKADGTIQVDAPEANVVVNCVDAAVTASGKVDIDTPVVNMTGDLAVTGTVTGAAGSTFGGIVVDTHTHGGSPTAPTGGVTPTGAPVP